jgi:hypothetical protein
MSHNGSASAGWRPARCWPTAGRPAEPELL